MIFGSTTRIRIFFHSIFFFRQVASVPTHWHIWARKWKSEKKKKKVKGTTSLSSYCENLKRKKKIISWLVKERKNDKKHAMVRQKKNKKIHTKGSTRRRICVLSPVRPGVTMVAVRRVNGDKNHPCSFFFLSVFSVGSSGLRPQVPIK